MIRSADDLQNGALNLVLEEDYLDFTVPTAWLGAGDTKLSYTTIVGLLEAVRDTHWQELGRMPKHMEHDIDVTCASLEVEFLEPVLPGERYRASYCVTGIGSRSYEFAVRLSSTSRACTCVIALLTLVFIKASTGQATSPPDLVAARLGKLRTRTLLTLGPEATLQTPHGAVGSPGLGPTEPGQRSC